MKRIVTAFIILAMVIAATASAQDIDDLEPDGSGWSLRAFPSYFRGMLSVELKPFEPGDSRIVSTDVAGEVHRVPGEYEYRTFRGHGDLGAFARGYYSIDNNGRIFLHGPIEEEIGYEKSIMPADGSVRLSVQPVSSRPFTAAIVEILEHESEHAFGSSTLHLLKHNLEVAGHELEPALGFFPYYTTDNTRVRTGPGLGFSYEEFTVFTQDFMGTVDNLYRRVTETERSETLATYEYLPPVRRVSPIGHTRESFPIGNWNARWWYVRIHYNEGESGPEYGWIYGALIAAFDEM